VSQGVSKKLSLIVAIFILLLATLALARAPAGGFLFRRGLQAKHEWRLDNAVRYFVWAAWLQSDNARARFEKGHSLQLRGDFLASQKEFEALIQTDDPALQAELLNALGINHFNFNEPDRAIELHQQSLEITKQIGDRRIQAQSLINLSRVLYHSKGDGDKALENLQQALKLAREAKDEISEANALRNAGVIYWWHKGERTRPLKEFYLPALAIYQRQNDLHGAAVTLSNIGLVHWYEGDVFQSLKHQSESIAIKERIGDMAGLSDSYLYLGWFYAGQQNYRKAIEYLTQSMELSKSIGYRLGQSEAEASLVGNYIGLKEFDKAIELHKRFLERDRANPMLFKYRLAWLGGCYRLKGEPITARQYFEETLALNKQAGNESEVGWLTIIGETYQDTNEWRTAAEYLTRAEEIGLQQKEKNWWHWLQNRCAFARQWEHEGQHDKALKYLLEATEIETLLFGSNKAASLQGQNREVYDQAFTSLLASPDESKTDSQTENKQAFRLLEQLKYRAFRNLFVRVSDQKASSALLAQKEQAAFTRIQQASKRLRAKDDFNSLNELRRTYSEYEDAVLQSQLDEAQYNLAREAKPAELSEAQGALDNETAVIEYLYAEEKVFALVITRSSLQSVELPVTRANLLAKVKLLRALIFDNAKANDDWQFVAEDLRQILIEPLEQTGALKDKQKLGIVPFGFLHDLPFAALVRNDKKSVPSAVAGGSYQNHFLVEDYTIFHIPSATFLTRSIGQTKPPEQTLLSFGINEADEEELPLRFAEEEAKSVATLFNGQTFVNANATETELKKLAPRFRYIHLATHAVSEPMMPLLSRLKLKSTAEDDGNLTVREIFNLQLNADLVTLGACRTGQSYSSSSNQSSEVDRLSLHEAFLHAGTHSVIATLFPIEDRSTLELMRTFYTNLRIQNKAEALAATQRAALSGQLSYSSNNQTYQLTHPRHWSAFILVGDYR